MTGAPGLTRQLLSVLLLPFVVAVVVPWSMNVVATLPSSHTVALASTA